MDHINTTIAPALISSVRPALCWGWGQGPGGSPGLGEEEEEGGRATSGESWLLREGGPALMGAESANPDRPLPEEPGGTLVDVSLCVDGGGVPVLGVLRSTPIPAPGDGASAHRVCLWWSKRSWTA